MQRPADDDQPRAGNRPRPHGQQRVVSDDAGDRAAGAERAAAQEISDSARRVAPQQVLDDEQAGGEQPADKQRGDVELNHGIDLSPYTDLSTFPTY